MKTMNEMAGAGFSWVFQHPVRLLKSIEQRLSEMSWLSNWTAALPQLPDFSQTLPSKGKIFLFLVLSYPHVFISRGMIAREILRGLLIRGTIVGVEKHGLFIIRCVNNFLCSKNTLENRRLDERGKAKNIMG